MARFPCASRNSRPMRRSPKSCGVRVHSSTRKWWRRLSRSSHAGATKAKIRGRSTFHHGRRPGPRNQKSRAAPYPDPAFPEHQKAVLSGRLLDFTWRRAKLSLPRLVLPLPLDAEHRNRRGNHCYRSQRRKDEERTEPSHRHLPLLPVVKPSWPLIHTPGRRMVSSR